MLMLLPPLPAFVAGWPAYSLFYLLGFGVAGGLLLLAGQRRGYPWRPWLLLVAGTVLALIAGTRLVAGSAADWQALLRHGHWGAGDPLGRSVLGGMLAAGLALAGLRRLLGFGRAAADAFALPFVLGLAVQGVGCLLVGCCFGEVLGAGPGLGLTYGPGSLPFQAQVLRGLVPATAAHSLPVHAAQLYQALLCLGIAAGLLAGRRALARRPGRALPLAFGLYAAGRFGLEFLRDPLGDVVGAGLWLGLKPVQWGLLAAAAVLLALVAWRSRQPLATGRLTLPTDQPLPNLLLLLGLLLLPPVLLPGGFDLGETLVLHALLLPVLVLEATRLLQVLRLARPLPVALLLLSGGLMSQAPAPADSTVAGRLTISLDARQSEYTDVVATSDCGTTRDLTEYRHRAQVAGGEARYDLPHQSNGPALSLGLGAWSGTDKVGITQVIRSVPAGLSRLPGTAFPLYAISPFAEVNFTRPRRFGGGLRMGVNIGKLGYRLPTYYDTTVVVLRVGAQIMYWLGWRETVYLQSDLGLGSNCLGHYLARFGVGSGLGRRTGRFVLAGVAAPTGIGTPIGNDQTELPGLMGFVSGQVQLPHTSLSLEPTLISDFSRNYQVNLRLNWQLPAARR